MTFAIRALRSAAGSRHAPLARTTARRAYSVMQDPMTGEFTTPLPDIEVRDTAAVETHILTSCGSRTSWRLS
jgi:hypothetical protein